VLEEELDEEGPPAELEELDDDEGPLDNSAPPVRSIACSLPRYSHTYMNMKGPLISHISCNI